MRLITGLTTYIYLDFMCELSEIFKLDLVLTHFKIFEAIDEFSIRFNPGILRFSDFHYKKL